MIARALIVLLFALASQTAFCEDLLMVRSKQAFPEAMLSLQQSLNEHGYTLARVQRVDIGLQAMGYKTDKYRVVFFGKAEEIRHLSDKHPELIPYLPPKISIFAENKQTQSPSRKHLLRQTHVFENRAEVALPTIELHGELGIGVQRLE